MELTQEQVAKVQGLRDFADRLEANPELLDGTNLITVYGFVEDGPTFARMALALGNIDKEIDDDKYRALTSFGPLLDYRLITQRENVCERIVVATFNVEVEEQDPDLVAAALATIPTRTTTVTHEEVEWQCPPSLHELATQ